MLQVASTSSNLLYVPNYASMPNFHTTFSNFLNKQFVDVLAGTSLVGSVVRVPSNPNYYRIPRSIGGIYHKVTLTYETDPSLGNAQVYTSHYDPFPDQLSNCNCTEGYRTSIYTYEYYFPERATETVPVKQNLTTTQLSTHSFMTVAGTNLRYTISVTTCPTLNCITER